MHPGICPGLEPALVLLAVKHAPLKKYHGFEVVVPVKSSV
jgi:hypothetical protein